MNITYAPSQTSGVTTLMSVSDFSPPAMSPAMIGAIVGAGAALFLGKKVAKWAIVGAVGYYLIKR